MCAYQHTTLPAPPLHAPPPPAVNIDMQRVLTSVLLQETQPLDSKGERTIASDYTTWYVWVCICGYLCVGGMWVCLCGCVCVGVYMWVCMCGCGCVYVGVYM